MRKPLIVGLLAVLLFAGWWLYRRGHAAEASDTSRLAGNVDIREVNLGFRVSGRVAELLKDEGDPVQAGDMVARLDDEPYKRQVAEVKAQVVAARARLDLLESGYRPQEVTQAQALVREREVSLGNAERVYRRQEQLLENKTVSIQDRDDAQARFREAEARLKSAREQLALLELGFRPEEVAQAKADLARAEAALATAELRVEDSVLKAPSTGVVITRATEPGAVVQAGATVLTVSLKSPVWVRTYVNEPNLGRIHEGMEAEVHTDSRPGKPYRARVGYVSPRAEFTPKNVETEDLRTSLVYRVRLVVADPDDGLRQGMPVTVKLRAN